MDVVRRPRPGREAFSLPMLQTGDRRMVRVAVVLVPQHPQRLRPHLGTLKKRLAIRKTGISDQTRIP